jgi:hypothetical protein
MAKTSKPAPAADPSRKQAVIYARTGSACASVLPA